MKKLGKTENAQDLTVKKLADGPYRFPAFWPEDIDWTPDHNWGGCGMIGLQEMLMQTHDDKIRLLPAWPEEWNVDFKLHAPQQTIVQGQVRSGDILSLQVAPEHRRKDVITLNSE